MKAVVLGGTGAVGVQHAMSKLLLKAQVLQFVAWNCSGIELVGQLLNSLAWSHVTTIGRREVVVPQEYQGYETSKLDQQVVNMDKLNTNALDAFKGANTVFCAPWEQHAAGSAEAFRKVDLHYIQLAAQAAKQSSVGHFSLCSAKGANANVWASDLAPFHALLYAKTKGQAEEAVKTQGIPAVSIFRPGVLDRGDKARSNEKITAYLPFLTKTHVRQVAKAMIQDAESTAQGSRIRAVVIDEAKMQ